MPWVFHTSLQIHSYTGIAFTLYCTLTNPAVKPCVSNANTCCQVSEYFFYWLSPYSSESEWTESTVPATLERIYIRREKDRLQCCNLDVRSENEVQFLAICADKICYSSASNKIVTLYRSVCGNSRLYHSTLWEVFLVSKIHLDRVLFLSS